MSTAWSWYVIALVAINIVGCAWLLWWTSRRHPGDPGPTETTHVWDGDITEYNKPLPRWWINLFWLTLAFGIGYLFWFGGLGRYEGYSKWSSQREHAREQAEGRATLERTFAAYSGKAVDVLARDPTAVRLGRSIFANTCATCHGSSGHGAIGFPNLRDDVWQWGGTPDQVLASVLDGREGLMPEWGTALTGMGGSDAVAHVMAYVRTLPDPASLADNTAATKGKKLYDSLCVACHGAEGRGDPTLGAPDLADDYWQYGNDDAALHHSIAVGRLGVMPAHRKLLGETRSRLVAAYVWSLTHAGTADPAVGGAASGGP